MELVECVDIGTPRDKVVCKKIKKKRGEKPERERTFRGSRLFSVMEIYINFIGGAIVILC